MSIFIVKAYLSIPIAAYLLFHFLSAQPEISSSEMYRTSFEDDTELTPEGWKQSYGGAATQISITEEKAKTGNISLRIENTDGKGGAFSSPAVTVSANRTYRGAAWIYLVEGRFIMYLEFFDSADKRIDTASKTAQITEKSSWICLTLSGVAPEEAQTVKLKVYSPIGSMGLGYIDDVELTEKVRKTGKKSILRPEIDFPENKPAYENGTVLCGDKTATRFFNELRISVNNVDGRTAGIEYFDFGLGNIHAVFFMNRSNTISPSNSVYTADVRAIRTTEEKLGTYRMSFDWLSNGLIKVETSLVLDNPLSLKKRSFSLALPTQRNSSGVYIVDGETNQFTRSTDNTFSADDLLGLKVIFFPQSAGQQRYSILPIQSTNVRLVNGNMNISPDEKGIISFLIDISGGTSTTTEAPNGVAMLAVDRLRLPDYYASSNLVQNPSFEAGLRYWAFRIFSDSAGAIPVKYSNCYRLDKHEAHSGNGSLRVGAWRVKNPWPLGTFPLPVIPGEKYTLSFFAKASGPNMQLTVTGRQVGGEFPVAAVKVGNAWERYSASFVPKRHFCVAYFLAGLPDTNSAEGYIWIDDVQVEKGEVSPFIQPVLSAELTSSSRGNFLRFGQQPDFKLVIQSAPKTSGSVHLTAEDFYFKTIFDEEIKFTTDSGGRIHIPLAELNLMVTETKIMGVFTVHGKFQLNNQSRKFSDTFRFSVMNFLENTQNQKNMFNFALRGGPYAAGPELERLLFRARAVGFGSGVYPLDENNASLDLLTERHMLYKKYGLDICGGKTVMDYEDNRTIRIGSLFLTNIRNNLNPSENELKIFEQICAEKAKRNPDHKIWYFFSESDPGINPLAAHSEAFAKFCIATMRGIKRGNPQAEVLADGGPCTIEKSGLEEMKRYLQAIKKTDPGALSGFDGVGGHYYRRFPESPDLDDDINAYLKMIDQYGVKGWPVYLNEGGNYSPFNLPAEGLSPYVPHSANGWYMGPLSYDFGMAERMCAALTARTWLVGLKYQDRIRNMNDWNNPHRTVDIDFTPWVYEKVPNTLGRILGDASFYKDIRPAPYVRCYVFKENKTGSPIAALWGHKENVDRWKEEAPVYQFDFKKLKVNFFDLMENTTVFPENSSGNTVIPASPFPIFIKGAPGSDASLCSAIASAQPASGINTQVEVSAYPAADDRPIFRFINRVSKEYMGEIKGSVNGVEGKWQIKIPGLGNQEVPGSVMSSAYGKILPFNAEYAFPEGNSGKITGSYLLLKDFRSGIAADGDFSEWGKHPSIDMGTGVSIQIVSVNKKLLIAVRTAVKGVASENIFSGIGVYIDPMMEINTWTESKHAIGTAPLGVYEIQKAKDNTMEAWCRFSQGVYEGMDPELMIVGKVQKLIKNKIMAEAGGDVMLIEIPEKIFRPCTLEPGSRFGLNLSIPVKGEKAKTLAPISGQNATNPENINFIMVIIGKIR